MDSIETQILNEFKEIRPSLLTLEDIVFNKIASMILKNNLFIMDISHRTKTVSSLKGKIEKKIGKYKSLFDVTDLCGFRVICYFADTVDDIASLLKSAFIIDYSNSIDKRDILQATEFGYISVHYICSLKEEDWKDHPELSTIRFEVQIRSVLQHAWAEIEHDLGYKSDFGVPRPIRREFSRVASLLEVADNQFVELRKNTQKYEEDVKIKIQTNEADNLLIDKVSLREYVNHNQTFISYVNEISSQLDIEIVFIDPENYLELLGFLKVHTLGDMSKFLNRNKDNAKTVIASKIKEFNLDIGTSNMILRYLCHSELINNDYSSDQIRQFVSLAVADKDRVNTYVQKIMNSTI